MAKQGSITRAFSTLLLGVTFSIILIYSLLILAYSWLIEDNIFNRQVMNEARYIQDMFHSTGNVVSPRVAYMHLHPNWQGLSPEMKNQQLAPTILLKEGRASTSLLKPN